MKAALEQYNATNPQSRILQETDVANHPQPQQPREEPKPAKPGDYDAIKMRYPIILFNFVRLHQFVVLWFYCLFGCCKVLY